MLCACSVFLEENAGQCADHNLLVEGEESVKKLKAIRRANQGKKAEEQTAEPLSTECFKSQTFSNKDEASSTCKGCAVFWGGTLGRSPPHPL